LPLKDKTSNQETFQLSYSSNYLPRIPPKKFPISPKPISIIQQINHQKWENDAFLHDLSTMNYSCDKKIYSFCGKLFHPIFLLQFFDSYWEREKRGFLRVLEMFKEMIDLSYRL
jgi:hypothetical protein